MDKAKMIRELEILAKLAMNSKDREVLLTASCLYSILGSLISGEIEGLVGATSAYSAGLLEKGDRS